MTNKRYAFQSTTRPSIVWVDFEQMSFREGSNILKLDLIGKLSLEDGLAENVSQKFKDPGELGLGFSRFGREALEFIAKRQDTFNEITKLVPSFSAHKNIS